jgi:prevent-host-death family protein
MPDEFMTIGEARDSFSDAISRVAFGKARIVLTRRGKPLAALVPIEDIEALEALEDARDAALIRDRLAEWREAGKPGASLEDYINKHGIDPAAADR